jgi:bacterioferritin-associated ferredoxin
MAQSRLSMRKIRDVLRLSAAGLSKRQIAASLGIGQTAAGACLCHAREVVISWPLSDDLDDDAWRVVRASIHFATQTPSCCDGGIAGRLRDTMRLN